MKKLIAVAFLFCFSLSCFGAVANINEGAKTLTCKFRMGSADPNNPEGMNTSLEKTLIGKGSIEGKFAEFEYAIDFYYGRIIYANIYNTITKDNIWPRSSFIVRNGEIIAPDNSSDDERFGDKDIQLGIQNVKTGNYIDFRCLAK